MTHMLIGCSKAWRNSSRKLWWPPARRTRCHGGEEMSGRDEAVNWGRGGGDIGALEGKKNRVREDLHLHHLESWSAVSFGSWVRGGGLRRRRLVWDCGEQLASNRPVHCIGPATRGHTARLARDSERECEHFFFPEKVLPTSPTIIIIRFTSLNQKIGYLCSLNYWNRPIYLPRWFSKWLWLTWHRASCPMWNHIGYKEGKLNFHDNSDSFLRLYKNL